MGQGMKTVISIDVGATKIASALVSYGAEGEPPTVSQRHSIPTDASCGGAAVLESLVALATEFVESGAKPVGVGVGTTGVVDPASGRICHAVSLMPGWFGQPVKTRLEEALSLPAAVLGDVQAHALGEARWGAARGAQSCLCVAPGTGLGGAFVMNGQVILGSHGAAGHIGHTLHPTAAGMTCGCGTSDRSRNTG